MRNMFRRVLTVLAASLVLVAASNANADFLVSFRGAYDLGPNRIGIVSDSGAYVGDFLAPGQLGLAGPTGMAIGPNGHLYVANTFANNVLEINLATKALVQTFSGFNGPTGLRFSGNNLFVANQGLDPQTFSFSGSTVTKLDVATNVATSFGGVHAAPSSVAISPTGSVYVSEFLANSVNVYNPNGTLLSTITDPGLTGPGGLGWDLSGNLLIPAVTSGSGTIFSYQPSTQILTPTYFTGNQFFPAGSYPLDATHELILSSAAGLMLNFAAGNPQPSVFSAPFFPGGPGDFNLLNYQTGVSIGDMVRVPEPATWLLAVCGALFVGAARIGRTRVG